MKADMIAWNRRLKQIFASSSSESLVTGAMPDISATKFVYQRRKVQKNSVPIICAQASENIKSNEQCLSAVSSDRSPIAARNGQSDSQLGPETEANGALIMPTVVCNIDPSISKSESISGCTVGKLQESDQSPENNGGKNNDFRRVNDRCSSSKSNVEHGSASMWVEVDDSGECSSSGVPAIEDPEKIPSERDFCISILRSEGLLETPWPINAHVSSEDVGIGDISNCSRSCKVCSLPELVCNMLICDHCEDPYHVLCCTPRVKKIPVDEWLCPSCQKKKQTILRGNTVRNRKSLNASSDLECCKIATCKGELSPIASMLADMEPYTTGVRIGKSFQADVPDWAGPIKNEEADCIGETLEMGHSEFVNSQNFRKPSRLSSIGNWLQCREVIEGKGEGIDGTVCGKWRRAPLFEVQTDDWECFRSVLWDPIHADCAVPQELDTNEILKQLKYIQMLRPRLAARRRKSSHASRNGSQGSSSNPPLFACVSKLNPFGASGLV